MVKVLNGFLSESGTNVLSERYPRAFRKIGTRQFHAKLADNTVARHILCIGDSNTEGFGMTKDVNRSYSWWSEIQRQLRAMYDTSKADDNASYFPVYYGSSPAGPTPPAVIRAFANTGTVTDLSNTASSASGMGFRAASMVGSSNYVTFTGYGTDFEVFYRAGAGQGTFQVTLDSVAGGTQATARAAGNLGGRTYSTGLTGLVYKSHTIKIAPSGAVGNDTIYIEGVKAYNGGINTGIHVWDSGHGGARAADFTNLTGTGLTMWLAGTFQDILNTGDAVAGGKSYDHIIIALGSNEVYGFGLGGVRTADQYYTEMDLIISNFITAGHTGGFTIVFPPSPHPHTEANIAPLREQAWRIATLRTNVDFVDLSQAIPSPTTGTSSAPLAVTISADQIHYNDRGMKWVAQLVGEAIIPKNGRVVSPTGAQPDIQTFTASGTWVKPTSPIGTYKTTTIIAIAGGSGGGSGRKDNTASTVRSGGGGGGGGGYLSLTYPTSLLGATETVTVGAGGAGGPAQTTNATNGTLGSAGGNSTFGSWVAAKANGFGMGGPGGTGAGSGGLGGSGTIAGAAGAASSATGLVGNGGSGAVIAPAGGGSGGGVTTAQVASAGGQGGDQQAGATSRFGGSGGAINTVGAVPANPSTAGEPMGGAAGGGGGSSVTAATNAGTGGAGALYGGGGGGGGASGNTGNSGAGGAGAAGLVLVITD